MSDLRPQSIIELIGPDQQVREASIQASVEPTTDVFAEECDSLGRCRIARRSQMMLAIRLCSGDVEVLPYATLARIRSHDTDRMLRLSFCIGDIVIEGSHLTRLFHYLCEQRVMEICQSDIVEVMEEQQDVCVHSVIMKLRE